MFSIFYSYKIKFIYRFSQEMVVENKDRWNDGKGILLEEDIVNEIQ